MTVYAALAPRTKAPRIRLPKLVGISRVSLYEPAGRFESAGIANCLGSRVRTTVGVDDRFVARFQAAGDSVAASARRMPPRTNGAISAAVSGSHLATARTTALTNDTET